jgi:hypothetical protein
LHSFCGACVCLITLRLSPLYLFFYEEKRLVFLSQNTKSFRSHWPTLKTSRDINSNETREENDINRRIFSVRITRARLVSFYSLLCASRERQRRSILGHFLLFFLFVLGKMQVTGGGEFPYLKTSNTTRAYITIGIVYTYIFERRRQTI